MRGYAHTYATENEQPNEKMINRSSFLFFFPFSHKDNFAHEFFKYSNPTWSKSKDESCKDRASRFDFEMNATWRSFERRKRNRFKNTRLITWSSPILVPRFPCFNLHPFATDEPLKAGERFDKRLEREAEEFVNSLIPIPSFRDLFCWLPAAESLASLAGSSG